MIKSIMLDKEIDDKIKRMKQEYGFNFSDWVRRQFKTQFLSIPSKKKKICEHKESIAKLEGEIAEITDREDTYAKMFTDEEKRFLRNIPLLICQGYEWKPLMNRFNVEFSRSLLLDEFKSLVEVLNVNKKKSC